MVGAAGLGRALLIIALANLISILTSLSLAAIATNLRVKVGGDYYLISRTLGVEYGGALGVVLFLAQSISIAFYALGFGEAVGQIVGSASPWLPQAVAAAAVLALFVLAWMGADIASRFQYVVMAALFSAIAAFFIGGFSLWETSLVLENWGPASDLRFWAIFALFFPAVTGFTQGVSMSGDLKDPGRSLPLGTFLAVGFSAAVYLAMAVVFAATVPGRELVADYGAMRRITGAPWLVDAGVISATLSSALASFLGAPRILQALARDRVFPRIGFFAAGHGPTSNPRRGVLLSCAIALATIGLGRLNLIAPIVSMFFLVSYGLLNYATYYEARSQSPSFRPRWRFYDARLSLLGAIACLGAMVAIQPVAGALAGAILFAIQQYLRRTVEVDRWADSARSHHLQRVRESLHAIGGEAEHPRSWRPVILAFSDDRARRERIIRFGSWIEGGSGFTTAVRILEGSPNRRVRQEAEAELRAEIERAELEAFSLVVGTSELDHALPVILQAHGFGSVRPNTILVNWLDEDRQARDSAGRRSYIRRMRVALRHGCNVILLDGQPDEAAKRTSEGPDARRIDVWYQNDDTGRLMLLLAYLMTRMQIWEDAKIQILAPSGKMQKKEEAGAALLEMLREVRIDAEVVIVNRFDPPTIRDQSASASVTFLPFRLHEEAIVCPVPKSLDSPPDSSDPTSATSGNLPNHFEFDEVLGELRLTAMIYAPQDLELDAEPESGRPGEIAAAMDSAEKVAAVAKRAERRADKAAQEAAETQERLEKARTEKAGEEALAEREEAAAAAAEEAERLRSLAARARAKASTAEAKASALVEEDAGAEPPVDDEADPDAHTLAEPGSSEAHPDARPRAAERSSGGEPRVEGSDIERKRD